MKKSMTATAAGTAAGIAGLLAENIFFILPWMRQQYKSAPLKPAPGTEKAEKSDWRGKEMHERNSKNTESTV